MLPTPPSSADNSPVPSPHGGTQDFRNTSCAPHYGQGYTQHYGHAYSQRCPPKYPSYYSYSSAQCYEQGSVTNERLSRNQNTVLNSAQHHGQPYAQHYRQPYAQHYGQSYNQHYVQPYNQQYGHFGIHPPAHAKAYSQNNTTSWARSPRSSDLPTPPSETHLSTPSGAESQVASPKYVSRGKSNPLRHGYTRHHHTESVNLPHFKKTSGRTCLPSPPYNIFEPNEDTKDRDMHCSYTVSADTSSLLKHKHGDVSLRDTRLTFTPSQLAQTNSSTSTKDSSLIQSPLDRVDEGEHEGGSVDVLCNVRSKVASRQITDEKEPEQSQLPSVDYSIVDKSADVKGDIMQWVDATRDADCELSTPPTQTASNSVASSPAFLSRSLMTEELPGLSTKMIVLEILQILQDQEDSFEPDEVQMSTRDYINYCTTPTTEGSGSPKSGTSPSGTSLGLAGRYSQLPTPKDFDRGDDEEPPAKKSGGNQGLIAQDIQPSNQNTAQIPCPLLESGGCQGTNATISELLRSLQNRHRIVICKDCCALLSVSDEEKKPENVLKRHVSEGCEPKCINHGCSDVSDSTATHHRRTEKCPSWKALSKEMRWSFIWSLIHPLKTPPYPDFLPGIGFEHSTERRPCKQQSRARGTELCAALLRDIDAKERRNQLMEKEMAALKERNEQLQKACDEKTRQLQERYDDKVINLENIIETLLERLTENDVGVPRSLHKRLCNECPNLGKEFANMSTPIRQRKPPTPEDTPERQSAPIFVTPSRPQSSFEAAPANQTHRQSIFEEPLPNQTPQMSQPYTNVTEGPMLQHFSQDMISHGPLQKATQHEIMGDAGLNDTVSEAPSIMEFETWLETFSTSEHIIPKT